MAKEQDDDAPLGHENIRRVYALPAEMVDRITKFQKEKALTSEVEAVRRLLDESLKSRDNLTTIINRLLAKLGQTRIAAEAARDVLAGHPLVTTISFGETYVSLTLKNEDRATVFEDGGVSVTLSGYGRQDTKWVPTDPKNPYAGGNLDIDLDIPF
ncbi:hypothetical protein [Frigidibacter oleivorans]|uniref:hypothetical protein n=1 Tax=Frigidibacter oleivorans TaxID=2487129 RepID=UPI000F8EAC8B|nr:hypothetical protein [Frigidibacter oleivorans]